jgi:hypothetical protein
MLLEEYDGLIGLKREELYLGGGVDGTVYADHIEPAYTGGELDKAKFVKSFGVVGLVGAYNAELKRLRGELRAVKADYDNYRKEKEEHKSRLYIRLNRAESERNSFLGKLRSVRDAVNSIGIYD